MPSLRVMVPNGPVSPGGATDAPLISASGGQVFVQPSVQVLAPGVSRSNTYRVFPAGLVRMPPPAPDRTCTLAVPAPPGPEVVAGVPVAAVARRAALEPTAGAVTVAAARLLAALLPQ